MKHVGKIAVCLASGLALNAALRADDAVLPGNPYAPVVARNIFGLNPPPPVDLNQPDPPVKITPNGIMSIFGHLQVLFKVSNPPTPGKPAGDTSYILSEGQRQDDVEVTHINEKSGVVTFNNHGIVQELPLTKAPAITTPMPMATGVYPQPGLAGTAPGGGNNGIGFGNRFGGGGGGRNRGGNNADDSNNGSNLRNVPTRNQQPQMTPEEAVVAIEVNREITKQQVIEGNMPPLPPTEMTPSDATSVGGAPLVTPSPP
jgi:hypothetical protein